MWNIKKIISKGDYNYCTVYEDHPNATNKGYILEHRIVMENYLNRLLLPNEIVHHIDGNKKNNKIENLQLLDSITHNRQHGLEQGKSLVTLKCPYCKVIFTKARNKTHLVYKHTNSTSCSKSCGAKFGHMKKDLSRLSEVELAIQENVVEEYTAYNK